MSADRIPAETFHPGEFIQEELAARGWTQAQLAEITGFSPQFINDLIRGRRDVSARFAIILGAAFGTSAEFWMNLQLAQELAWHRGRVGVDDIEAIRARAASHEIQPAASRADAGRGEEQE